MSLKLRFSGESTMMLKFVMFEKYNITGNRIWVKESLQLNVQAWI
jgi:hypothetical protein